MKKDISIAYSVFKALILKKRIPIFISWTITNRCNYCCPYCTQYDNTSVDIPLENCLGIIDLLADCGTQVISFTGGEPLLHDDIGEILSHARKRGMYIKIFTNGSLISERIKDLKNAHLVQITFNGPEATHDIQRTRGSFESIMKGIKMLKDNDIAVSLNCILNKMNLEHLDYFIQTAKDHGIKVAFQPLERRFKKNQYIENNLPDREECRKVFEKLVELKKANNQYISNSLPGLKYLYDTEIKDPGRCWAGILHYRITAEGELITCDRDPDAIEFQLNCTSKELLRRLQKPAIGLCVKRCRRNFSSELNLLLSCNISALLNLKNLLSRK